jgi:hypothetical protein
MGLCYSIRHAIKRKHLQLYVMRWRFLAHSTVLPLGKEHHTTNPQRKDFIRASLDIPSGQPDSHSRPRRGSYFSAEMFEVRTPLERNKMIQALKLERIDRISELENGNALV